MIQKKTQPTIRKRKRTQHTLHCCLSEDREPRSRPFSPASCRGFVPLEASLPPTPTRLDPNLDLLIATVGFSVDASRVDSDSSDDGTRKFSRTASTLCHDFLSGRLRPGSYSCVYSGDELHWGDKRTGTGESRSSGFIRRKESNR